MGEFISCDGGGMILGIDPAKEGAAVTLNHQGEVREVWSWIYRKRKNPVYVVTYSCLNIQGQIISRTYDVRDGGLLGKHIGLELDLYPSCQVGIEDAYVNTSHKKTDKLFKSKMNASVQSGLRVARFGGELIGGLSSCLGYKMEGVEWMMATKWRGEILRLNPFTRRDRCKEVSLSVIPVLCPSIKPHLDIHGQLDHITDACGVALYVRGKQ